MDTAIQKKLHVGWFTFTCCEDSTVIFTELLNDHWREWKKLIDFRHARVLKSHNVLDELDVAFVEGALSSQAHIDKLKEIRQKSKKIVAVGSCAVVGLPSAQRNTFGPEDTEAIREPYLEKFKYLPKVLKLADVVKIDAQLPGCPMDPKQFLALLDNVLKEFGIIK
ncbi:MAG TPA: hypothetical protein VI998_03220 [Patescibacteria group bacterium]|nr:hypothetical protein [Patescibacteria group bacterium]